MSFAPLSRLAEDLRSGATTSRTLTEHCLEAIADPAGEGRRAFPHGVAAGALEAAEVQDRLRRAGRAPSPYAGVPISVKDNMDQAGEVTRAGSRLLGGEPAAGVDAPAVARLRAAGFVVVGRTGMTEFAFSGLGLNPHYGTPVNPRAPDTPRIPGGSSAGAAVSVAAGMACAAIGTDTGGSCRIPAAFCGLAGWKPSSGRVPLDGIFPLSTTLDSVGALGLTSECCAILDAAMAGAVFPEPTPCGRPERARLGALTGLFLDDLDASVAQAYAAALDRLRAAGVSIKPLELPALARVAEINARGGFSALELHKRLEARLTPSKGLMDSRVLRRLQLGAGRTAAERSSLQRARAELIAEVGPTLDAFDAVLAPTTPFVAPSFAELDRDEDYDRINAQALRNTCIANMLDRPSITLPCQASDALPVGLMLTGSHGGDLALLALARTLEPYINVDPRPDQATSNTFTVAS